MLFLNDYITHLIVEEGPGGPPDHKDDPPGLVNYLLVCGAAAGNTIGHNCYKPVQHITLHNPCNSSPLNR